MLRRGLAVTQTPKKTTQMNQLNLPVVRRGPLASVTSLARGAALFALCAHALPGRSGYSSPR